jgi:hypothetical protein
MRSFSEMATVQPTCKNKLPSCFCIIFRYSANLLLDHSWFTSETENVDLTFAAKGLKLIMGRNMRLRVSL